MASLLAKLRRRAVSLTSQRTLSAADADTQAQDAQESDAGPSNQIFPSSTFVPPSSELFVDRRIRPDVNLLLERYSLDDTARRRPPQDTSPQGTGIRALSPSTRRRHSMDGGTLMRQHLRAWTETDDNTPPRPSVTPKNQHPAELPSSSEWATFGRIQSITSKHHGPIPHRAGRNSTISTPSASLRSRTHTGHVQHSGSNPSDSIYGGTFTNNDSPSTTTTSRRTHSRPETPWTHPGNTNTPTTSSSRSYPHHHADPSSISTPHTFGRPTPPQSVTTLDSMREFGVNVSTLARSEWYDDTPPLPPLNHPAFNRATLTNPTTPKNGADSAPPSAFASHYKHYTYHPAQELHERHDQRFQQHLAFHSVPSLPLAQTPTPDRTRSGRSRSRNKRPRKVRSRSRMSLPSKTGRNNHNGSQFQPEPGNDSIAWRAVSSIRSRSIDLSKRLSGTSSHAMTSAPSRRSSAEWSARKASMVRDGGGRDEDGNWQAQVSREILRMSGVGLGLPARPAIAGGSHGNDALIGLKSTTAPANTTTYFTELAAVDPQFDHRESSEVGSGDAGYSEVTNIYDQMSNHASSVEGKGKQTPSKPAQAASPRPLRSIAKTLSDEDQGAHRRSASLPNTPRGNAHTPLVTPSKGKRKADEAGHDGSPEGTPPDRKKEYSSGNGGSQRVTSFAAEPVKDHSRYGSTTLAPSSYHRKRARLSTGFPDTPSSQDGAGLNAHNTNSLPRPPSRAASQVASARSVTHTHHSSTSPPTLNRASSRRSMSQSSIPISALLSPHAPSVSRSGTFHMRDPRRPPRKLASTGWALHFPDADEPGSGSPIHAWMFFIGFVVFPLWWVASFWRTPQTRRLEGGAEEKAVVVDDPQVEHDAKSWRFRCRVMAGISFLTYIPFIVLVSVFASRS